MNIRKAYKDDVQALIELYHQLLPWDELDYNQTKKIYEKILQDENYIINVIEYNERIISTCTLVIIKNLTHGGRPFGIIENVITKAEYRGKGYGKKLLRETIAYAKNVGCHKVMLQTRREEKYILDFYLKCGFSDKLSRGFMISFENDNGEDR